MLKGEDEELFYALSRINISVPKPPHDLETNRSNTFLHIHDDQERQRDKTRCNGQVVNTSLLRTPACDLNFTSYEIKDVKELSLDEAPFTMLDVELKCDPVVTPWCKC